MTKITFTINGTAYEADGKFGPDVSLNEYIRHVADLRGTKAMCLEGGCGACVVAVRAAFPPNNQIKTFAVNSCLVSILSCHGWEITTVEGIGNRTIGYHDIQTRLAKFNGTQCGYCTPGWVMNMYSLCESNKKLTMKDIENSFAGNICRCTGYRPIADAFKTFATDADPALLDKLGDLEDIPIKSCGVKCKKQCPHKNNQKTHFKLQEPELNLGDYQFIDDNKFLMIDCEKATKWFRAYNLADAFKTMSAGDYKLIAGNTGQGVTGNKHEYPSNVIDIFNVAELKGYTIDVNLSLGAGMPLSEMMELFQKLPNEKEEFFYLQQLYDHMDLVAHIPVRNALHQEYARNGTRIGFETLSVETMLKVINTTQLKPKNEFNFYPTPRNQKKNPNRIGTIGGNLFLKYLDNGFPSDLFVIFETVGAMLTIAESADKSETVTLPQYLKTDMHGKIITKVILPPLSKNHLLKTFKIMTRSQNTHALVNAGFLFKQKHNSNVIEESRIVFGNISPTFNHAKKTEAQLVDKDLFTNETLQLAVNSLVEEIDPIENPPEPSAAYRKMLAISLFYKAIISLCPDDKIDLRFKSGGEAFKRATSKGSQTFETDKSVWPLNQPVPKIEALVQCSGEATFANDMPSETNELFASYVTADAPAGSTFDGFDTSEAMKIKDVVAFYSAKDIPGENSFTPTNIPFITESEEILCSKTVKFYGQPVGIIVANREKIANDAAKLVHVKYTEISKNKPLLTIDDVLASNEKDKRVRKDAEVEPTEIGNDVKTVVYGNLKMGLQYHYYMEPQTTVAKPTEDGLEIYSATQWLDLTNVAIAYCLKIPVNSINVIVRRVGGGYGGKISRSVQTACAAAIVCHLQGKTCRMVVPLETNMGMIGKRIGTNGDFEIGVDNDGVIQYLKNNIYQNAGYSANETFTPLVITPFYNCYEHKRWKIEASSVLTDTPANTWCRAPFTTEGVAMIEYIMEKIAYHTGVDPMVVRSNNMLTEDNPIPDMMEELKRDAEYESRKIEIVKFNEANRWRKRVIKLIPMCVDLFYTGNFTSIVSIYHGDGTVTINHSGIEMGQGINTKAVQVCGYILGIPIEKISVKASSSFISPNAITTGGSVGSESVAFATMKACQILNERLEPFKQKADKVVWEEIVVEAFKAGINLQVASAFSPLNDGIKTYNVYGVGIMEIELDVLTGNHDIRRVDILEDTGRSLSPEIDIAQIEGAFIMGLGYWTSEEIIYDKNNGKLLTNRTWSYKPPTIKDIPADMRIYFQKNARNPYGILQSKATGEPALNLATVFSLAVREAVRAVRTEIGYEDQWVDIENPCTAENIFMAVGHKLSHFVLK